MPSGIVPLWDHVSSRTNLARFENSVLIPWKPGIFCYRIILKYYKKILK